ncbi:hypothetical protein LTR94_037345, partial [Friedmanniomyces endolithicus]
PPDRPAARQGPASRSRGGRLCAGRRRSGADRASGGGAGRLPGDGRRGEPAGGLQARRPAAQGRGEEGTAARGR